MLPQKSSGLHSQYSINNLQLPEIQPPLHSACVQDDPASLCLPITANPAQAGSHRKGDYIMNHLKTLAVALLIAALPIAPAAFASEWEHGDHDHGDRHDRHEQRWHHYQYRHYDHHDYDDRYRYDQHDFGYRTGIVLTLPAFPIIVLNKNLREAPIERHHH
jgi:hypothetical protein